MAVGSLLTVKSQQNTYQPLLLASIVFRDSQTDPTVLLVSTHALKSADGGVAPSGISGFPYNGSEFEARILNQEIAATQALSEQGIDVTPTVSLELADADKTLWTTYEKAIGFKGAKLTLYYIFWNVGANDFSSDYQTIFVGTCGPAKINDTSLRIQAVSRMNMNQNYLPVIRIQKRCPWVFPKTVGMSTDDATALHQAAADDPSIDAWHCGYSYLASGSNARGNAKPGGGHFDDCTFTFSDCLDRMGNRALDFATYAPIEKDSSNRLTARYGGVQWDQPAKFQSRGYGQPKSIDSYNAVNEGKYNDYVPMGWGTYWVDPVILNIVGDANFTRMEVLLGMGEFSNVRKVIVNDIEVDKFSSGLSAQQIALQLSWVEVTTGDRTGRTNGDTIYDHRGDPYGSMKVLSVTVPRQLTPSSSIPRVKVLVDGPKIRKLQAITSISVTGGTATATLVGPNTDIASNGVFRFKIVGNSKSDVNGDYSSLTNWTYGPPGTIEFPTGAANGTGTGGYILYEQATSNPAWIILDVLVWSGWRYDDIDLQTFMDAAVFYDESITYNIVSGYVDVDSNGLTVRHKSGADFETLVPGATVVINGVNKVVATVDSYKQFTITVAFVGALSNVTFLASGLNSHARFRLGFGLGSGQRISGADLIRQLRTACRSTIIPSSTTGKLQLFPDQTLAGQQPSAITGSNYATAIRSKSAGNVTTNGYVAWKFDYSSILPESNGQSSLQIDQLDIKDTPNRVSFPFFDEDNGYQSDSLTLVDSEDVGRVDQSVDGNIPVAGIPNFDQAKRIAATWMARNSRGNTRGDTGGTYIFTFKTSFKCMHLRVGHIVLFDYPQLTMNAGLLTGAGAALDGILARVTSIKPSTNFETVQITLQYHNDDWFVDIYEQNGFQRQRPQFRDALTRPSFPWAPYTAIPITADALLDTTDYQFGILQRYDDSADNRPLAKVDVVGKMPVNIFAKDGMRPPAIGIQGTTATTGGNVKGDRRYYIQVCARDADGLLTTPSDPSAPCVIDVPAGTNTNTLTVPITSWPKDAVSGVVFAGTTRSRMSYQTEVDITPPTNPASITITAYQEHAWGIPDVEFNSIGIRGKRCQHAGVIGSAVLASTATTIQLSLFSDNQFTTNQFAPVDGKPYYIILVALKGNGIPKGQRSRNNITTAGTVTVTKNWDGVDPNVPLESSIVGTGTSWNSGMVGKLIYIATNVGGNPFGTYSVVKSVEDSTHMTIIGPMSADTESGLAYEIYEEFSGADQYLPVASWKIASNNGDTFTLAGGESTLNVDRGDGTTGLQEGDVVVISMMPQTVGVDSLGNYVEDPNWVNALNPLLEGHIIQNASNTDPILITTSDNHGLLDRQKVYIQNCLGNTAANGVFYVQRANDVTFALYSDPDLTATVAGNGTYTGSGTVQRQLIGLDVHEEKGCELYCIFGTGAGTYYKIKDNTNTKVYIDGEWSVTPDKTSIFVINNPNWEMNAQSTNINNQDEDTPVTFSLDTPNYSGQVIFVQSFTQDGGQNEAFRSLCPWRLIYLYGSSSGGSTGLSAVHITVPGILGIGADLAPITKTNSDFRASAVHLELKRAPVGANFTVEIFLDATLWMTLTIAAGNTFIAATDGQILGAATIGAGKNIRVDITAVGTTTPGEDLSLSIYTN